MAPRLLPLMVQRAAISFLIKGVKKAVLPHGSAAPAETARGSVHGREARRRADAAESPLSLWYSEGKLLHKYFDQKDALLEKNLKLKMYYIYFGDHLYLFK